MVNQIYHPELQLNKANTSDTEAPFLDFHLSISNGFVSFKIYDKHDKFPFLDGGAQWPGGLMPRTPDPEIEGSSPTRVKPCCVLEQGT